MHLRYPTHLDKRLSEIEHVHVIDPQFKKPAPFVRLHGQRDRAPSARTIRNVAARLGIQFEDAITSDGLTADQLANRFKPYSPAAMLADYALDGAEVTVPSEEAN